MMEGIISAVLLLALIGICGHGLHAKASDPEMSRMVDEPVDIDENHDFDEQEIAIGWE